MIKNGMKLNIGIQMIIIISYVLCATLADWTHIEPLDSSNPNSTDEYHFALLTMVAPDRFSTQSLYEVATSCQSGQPTQTIPYPSVICARI